MVVNTSNTYVFIKHKNTDKSIPLPSHTKSATEYNLLKYIFPQVLNKTQSMEYIGY